MKSNVEQYGKPHNRKINPMHTFWVFGLGMGIGEWLSTGEISDLVIGFILGVFIWFILIITVWPFIYELVDKWIIKNKKF